MRHSGANQNNSIEWLKTIEQIIMLIISIHYA